MLPIHTIAEGIMPRSRGSIALTRFVAFLIAYAFGLLIVQTIGWFIGLPLFAIAVIVFPLLSMVGIGFTHAWISRVRERCHADGLCPRCMWDRVIYKDIETDVGWECLRCGHTYYSNGKERSRLKSKLTNTT